MRFSLLASYLSNRTLILEKPPHPGWKPYDNRDAASDGHPVDMFAMVQLGSVARAEAARNHSRVQADIDRVARCDNLRYHQLSQKVHNAPGNRFSACTLWVANQYMTRHVPFLTRSQQRATLCPRTLSANRAPAPASQNAGEILPPGESLAAD
jgi:hypothetical protein